MYSILLGSGIALLGWALRRTRIARRLVGWIGVVLGVLTAGIATISLVAVYGGDSVGWVLFDVATLLVPLLYLWAMALGIDIYR